MPIKDEKQKQKQPDGKRGKYGPSDDSGGGGGGKPKEPGRRPEPAEAKFLKNRHMDQVEGLSLLAVRPAESEIFVSVNFVVQGAHEEEIFGNHRLKRRAIAVAVGLKNRPHNLFLSHRHLQNFLLALNCPHLKPAVARKRAPLRRRVSGAIYGTIR